MKKIFAFFKEHIIELLILFMALIILTATIFSAVVILNPDRFSGFPLVRETVLALSTAAMVFATLMLALGTFRIIRQNRERESRSIKENWINEIIHWAEHLQNVTSEDDPNLYSHQGTTWVDVFTFRSSIMRISRNRGDKVKYIAKSLDKDLYNAVSNSCSKIESCIESESGVLSISKAAGKPPHSNPYLLKFTSLFNDATTSANDVIKIASNLKLSLLP